MANLNLNNTWQSFYALTGLAVGTAVNITNQSSNTIYAQEQVNNPATDSPVGVNLEPTGFYQITAGSGDMWMRVFGGPNGTIFWELA